MNAYLRPVVLLLTAVLYICWNALGPAGADEALGGLLVLGLAAIGIPHGALDVWTHEARSPGRNASYIVGYLACIGILLLGWHTFPHAGLLLLLGLSAWHFGQADFTLWGITRGHFTWGVIARGTILVWHLDEVLPIIQQMGVTESAQLNVSDLETTSQLASTAGLIACTIAALRLRNWDWLLTILLIAVTPWIPVLLSFGLYFIGQHSASGWHHLQTRLGWSSKALWWKAAPFTLGAVVLMGVGIVGLGRPEMFFSNATYGAFFMLLGSISIPHIFESHWFLMATTKR